MSTIPNEPTPGPGGHDPLDPNGHGETRHEPDLGRPTGGLDLPATPAVGPLAGVTAPRPPDPATTRLLETAPPAVGAPAAPAPVATRGDVAGRQGPRIRTTVFGLVMLAVAGTVLVAQLADIHVDGGAVALVVLVAAGLLLLVGGLAAAAKEARGGPGA